MQRLDGVNGCTSGGPKGFREMAWACDEAEASDAIDRAVD